MLPIFGSSRPDPRCLKTILLRPSCHDSWTWMITTKLHLLQWPTPSYVQLAVLQIMNRKYKTIITNNVLLCHGAPRLHLQSNILLSYFIFRTGHTCNCIFTHPRNIHHADWLNFTQIYFFTDSSLHEGKKYRRSFSFSSVSKILDLILSLCPIYIWCKASIIYCRLYSICEQIVPICFLILSFTTIE